MRVVAGALVCAMFAGQAGAATFYYVSEAYTFSNYESGVIPTFTTGVLEIDETKLTDGLANLRVEMQMSADGSSAAWPEYASFKFENPRETLLENGGLPYSFFQLDAGAQIVEWDLDTAWEYGQVFRNLDNPRVAWEGNSTPMNGASWNNGDDPTNEDMARKFLREKGYREGSKQFNELLAKHIWQEGYGATGGRWFTDALDWAAAVADTAIKSVTTNFYSIGKCKVASAAFEAEDFAPPVA